jgi:hypothetical protein
VRYCAGPADQEEVLFGRRAASRPGRSKLAAKAPSALRARHRSPPPARWCCGAAAHAPKWTKRPWGRGHARASSPCHRTPRTRERADDARSMAVEHGAGHESTRSPVARAGAVARATEACFRRRPRPQRSPRVRRVRHGSHRRDRRARRNTTRSEKSTIQTEQRGGAAACASTLPTSRGR